ncbi:MAG: DUF4118 domain-containing protein [Phenylobacterium sp.]|nr:MAG: DUF4118 domain-containing protein [Phenylobacterium sp.]
MSDSFAEPGAMVDAVNPARSAGGQVAEDAPRAPSAVGYAASLLLVGLATVLAFVVQHLIAAPNLTLIYVLPVVVAATFFGWGPALLAAVAGVALFDFFFTAPFYSFQIANPADLWATALLLVVAAIVSSVAAESRRQAVESRRAARQAQALQALAHVIIEAAPQAEILDAAALALHRIFEAPAVIFLRRGTSVGLVAKAGGAKITSAEEDAARGAIDSRVATRGETYPYDQATFDFWPVTTPAGGCAVGVDFTRARGGRPASPDRFVDVVGGYLAAALAAPTGASPVRAPARGSPRRP